MDQILTHYNLNSVAVVRRQIKFRRRLYDADELATFFHQDSILEFFSVRRSSWALSMPMCSI